MMAVPRFLQPANPPAPFVGRAAERARLAQALERAPVTVLWGFSGIGKSALVNAVLAERFPGARERTLVVDTAAARDPLDAARAALAQLPGWVGPVSVQGSDAEDARALLDALDAAGLWLVLDGIERLDDSPALLALLELAQRFARQARVLCICREDPRLPALRTQTLGLSPLPAAELRALLAEVQPGLGAEESTQLVARAQGSPWRLLQLSVGADDGGGPEASLLALSPASQSLLRTLALLPTSVPAEVLGKATRLPGPEVLESLARRGYLELSARGVRLHDAARALVGATLDAEERSLRLTRLRAALETSADPAAAAAARALSLEQTASVVANAAGPDWIVDGPTMRIVLPDGAAVDLSKKKVLFDLLATLCRHGGKASKEQLLEVAWGVREYHPLHHDNRLKVAVRKLRRLLEDHLGADPIEASDDGYRLRGRIRFVE